MNRLQPSLRLVEPTERIPVAARYGVGAGANSVVAVGGEPANTNGTSGVAVGVYGGEGSESHWNGSTWAAREVLGATSMSPPSSAIGLYAVGGRSATDVYAVGATGGVTFHSSGNDRNLADDARCIRRMGGLHKSP